MSSEPKYQNFNATQFPAKPTATKAEIMRHNGFETEEDFERLLAHRAIRLVEEGPAAAVEFDEAAYEAKLAGVLREGGWSDQDVKAATEERRRRAALAKARAEAPELPGDDKPPLPPTGAGGDVVDPAKASPPLKPADATTSPVPPDAEPEVPVTAANDPRPETPAEKKLREAQKHKADAEAARKAKEGK